MLEKIISAYRTFISCEWVAEEEQIESLKSLISFSKENGFMIKEDYKKAFIEAVNQKLALNNISYQAILDKAFHEKFKLNYISKVRIKSLIDATDKEAYFDFLKENCMLTQGMIDAFVPVKEEKTMNALRAIIISDSKYNDVLNSIFSRFCFNLFDKKSTSSFFSKSKGFNDYYELLSSVYPDITDRGSAMSFIDVSEELFLNGYEDGCNIILNAIKESYKLLNNHCDMIIYIPKIDNDGPDNIQWKLYSDLTLYAEKHVKEHVNKTYFRWQKIATQTCEYINQIVPFNAEFNYAFQGFTFKDCFVLNNCDNKTSYSLLLIFEKNVRDERIVNCPACHSSNIQGNSYPILNVRSWECENPLCPDRSKYNRGKRYAFMSLFRQKQMLEDENRIPEASIAKWHLDCVSNATKKDAFEMAIRHYSCNNDGILLYTKDEFDCFSVFSNGRKIRIIDYQAPKDNLLVQFKGCTYFHRYFYMNTKETDAYEQTTIGNSKIYRGDCFDVLKEFQDETFDAAVTSPPYYNAKSYSKWANIYCYLYDMYNISKEVYRTLKVGGVYLFNIFDYFDNENNVALSAMGNKRMILGAYMIDIFSRIGYNIVGNIIWDKGEIQGNRSFNQGNLTPYYQAPLNCWEHIIVVSKGTPNSKFNSLSSDVKCIRPVIKMIRGKNILGHDAPYPKDIPELLIGCLKKSDIVLDPFLGSGTTAIIANASGVKSVGIEKSNEYYELCKKLITRENRT